MTVKLVKHDKDTLIAHDEDSGLPVAILRKSSWGRSYHVSPHPALVKHFPHTGPDHSFYGVGAKLKSMYPKDKNDAEDKINSFVNNHAHNDFSNKVEFRKRQVEVTNRSGEKENMPHYDAYDHKTGEHMASFGPYKDTSEAKRSYGYAHPYRMELNKDYKEKHGIDDSVIKAKTTLFNDGEFDSHRYNEAEKLHGELEKLHDLKGKKATLTGTSQTKDGSHKIYKINGTAEEGSQAHEKHLTGQGFTVDRTSPTKFTAVKNERNRNHYATSTVHGDRLHATHSTISSDDQFNLMKNTDIIENYSIPGGILILEEDEIKSNKYSYISSLAKLI